MTTSLEITVEEEDAILQSGIDSTMPIVYRDDQDPSETRSLDHPIVREAIEKSFDKDSFDAISEDLLRFGTTRYKVVVKFSLKATAIYTRLDEVLGKENWSVDYTVQNYQTVCTLQYDSIKKKCGCGVTPHEALIDAASALGIGRSQIDLTDKIECSVDDQGVLLDFLEDPFKNFTAKESPVKVGMQINETVVENIDSTEYNKVGSTEVSAESTVATKPTRTRKKKVVEELPQEGSLVVEDVISDTSSIEEEVIEYLPEDDYPTDSTTEMELAMDIIAEVENSMPKAPVTYPNATPDPPVVSSSSSFCVVCGRMVPVGTAEKCKAAGKAIMHPKCE